MKYNLSIPDQRAKFVQYAKHLTENKKYVELKVIRKRRSLAQNNYLHLILAWWGLEYGYTLEESKHIYKKLCCAWYEYEKNGETFYKKSSELNTKQMTETISYFRDWSAQNGLYLPSPNEQEQLESIQNQLDIYGNKKYVGA